MSRRDEAPSLSGGKIAPADRSRFIRTEYEAHLPAADTDVWLRTRCAGSSAGSVPRDTGCLTRAGGRLSGGTPSGCVGVPRTRSVPSRFTVQRQGVEDPSITDDTCSTTDDRRRYFSVST